MRRFTLWADNADNRTHFDTEMHNNSAGWPTAGAWLVWISEIYAIIPPYKFPNIIHRLMTLLIFSYCGILLYLSAGVLLARRLLQKQTAASAPIWYQKNLILSLTLTAGLIHMGIVYSHIILASGTGLNFGVWNALSLMSWMICLLITIAGFSKPLENLGIVMFPIAALAILGETHFSSLRIIASDYAQDLRFHILISIIAYSQLTLAAIQACLLAMQNHFLRNKHPGGFIRALPPLETMESLLFQLIALGFAFMSVALITGMIYLEDMFSQHLAHKTILSFLSWGLFGVLLWGRWRFGWRGRTAVRWTLSAFVVLFLGYFGSKVVAELILNR